MDAPRTSAAAGAPELTVYYDGGCPICRREIGAYRNMDGAERLDWVDVADPATEPGDDLDRQAALARMHVRDADGRLLSGAAAFAAMWRAFPKTRWLGRVAGTRPALAVLEPAYRLFLRARPLWRRG